MTDIKTIRTDVVGSLLRPRQLIEARQRFDEGKIMMKDPELKADAEKAKLDLDPASGDQVEQMVQAMFKADAAAVAATKSLLTP